MDKKTLRELKEKHKNMLKKKEIKKMKIYAIKDTKIGKMGKPFFEYNNDTATRLITAIVNSENKGDELSLFPEDKQLYCLGEFNDETGEITSKVDFLFNCIEVKKN